MLLVELRDVVSFGMQFSPAENGELFAAIQIVAKAAVFVKVEGAGFGKVLNCLDKAFGEREESDGLIFFGGVLKDECKDFLSISVSKGFQIRPFFGTGDVESDDEKSAFFAPDGFVEFCPRVKVGESVIAALLVGSFQVFFEKGFVVDFNRLKHIVKKKSFRMAKASSKHFFLFLEFFFLDLDLEDLDFLDLETLGAGGSSS